MYSILNGNIKQKELPLLSYSSFILNGMDLTQKGRANEDFWFKST